MSIPVFPQKKEADLLSWSVVWSARISAAPASVGLTGAQAAEYALLHAAFAASYSAVQDPSTNSKAAVIAKNQARENLLNGDSGAWELVRIVQAFPGTTDAMRGELGLRLPDVTPTPVPAPQSPPVLSIVAVLGRTVKVRLRDRDHAERRGKPDGVQGATVLYHVGDLPANRLFEWHFAMNVGRPVFDVELPADIPAGSLVWITAFWFNARKEPGSAAAAKSVRIGDGLALAA